VKPLRKPRNGKATDSIGWMFMGEMGGPCDKHCQMCYYAHQKNLVFYDLPTLINHANLFRHYYGLDGADITGGEATIYKDIVPLVAHCKSIGLSPRIITHGQNIHDKFRVENGVPLYKRIEAAGLDVWRYSLHGGSPASHDAVLGQEGSFKRLIDNINNPSVEMHFNTTLLDTNYKDLPVNVLVDRPPTVYNIIYFLPYFFWATDKGMVEADFQVKYREAAPYVGKVVSELEARGWEVNIRYWPLCIAEEYGFAENVCNYHQVPYDPWEWRLNVTQRTPMESIVKQGGWVAAERNAATSWMADRKNEKCDVCANKLICDGPPVQYQKKYGIEELRPIEGAVRIDPLHYQKERGVVVLEEKAS